MRAPTGSVIELERGKRYRIMASAGDDPLTGQRRRVSRVVRGTKRQAREELNRLLVEVADGRHATTAANVDQLLDAFLAWCEGRIAPGTVADWNGWAKRYLRPHLGQVRLRDLTPLRIDAAYKAMAAKGVRGRPLSPASIRRVHTVLRRALGQAVKWGWLDRNPAEHASPPPVRSQRVAPPAPADVARLLAWLDERQADLALFVRLEAVTGARPG